MKVAKWGNSLAVRLPMSLVQEQNIQEGDEIELHHVSERTFEVSVNEERKKALEEMRSLRFKLPRDYKFDRDEANARGLADWEIEEKTRAAS